MHRSYSHALKRRHRDFEDKIRLCKFLGITHVFAIRQPADPRQRARFDASKPS
ncbi:MAG TPA: hypothetical protein VMR54_08215 [Thermoanaerobaculia bacterium]|nr:hypothetical protein [Thermoanaerobaculia bacterium]